MLLFNHNYVNNIKICCNDKLINIILHNLLYNNYTWKTFLDSISFYLPNDIRKQEEYSII